VNLTKIREIRPYFKSGFLLIMADAENTEFVVSERAGAVILPTNTGLVTPRYSMREAADNTLRRAGSLAVSAPGPDGGWDWLAPEARFVPCKTRLVHPPTENY